MSAKRLKAIQKHQKVLDDVNQAKKALNPKKPKRDCEKQVLDTNTPLLEITKIFLSFVEYLKETALATKFVPLIIVITISITYVIEKFKVIKDMLLTIVKAIEDMENANSLFSCSQNITSPAQFVSDPVFFKEELVY